MRVKSAYLIIVIISVSAFGFAQTMNIHSTDGSVTQHNLSEIDSITFTISEEVQFLVNEDFDSYESNIFPSSGGWILLYNGSGNSDQIVSETVYNSSPKCMQLKGQPGWGAEMYFSLPEQPSIIYFEANILSLSGKRAWVGLKNESQGTWGTGYVGFDYYQDSLRAFIGDSFVSLLSAAPNTWYKIKVKYNSVTSKIDVWVNDVIIESELNVNTSSVGYMEVVLGAPNDDSGDFVYFDDIKVWYLNN